MKYSKAKKPVKRDGWLIVLIVGVYSCFSAEMRVWTDPDGSCFKGEFDKELFGDVLINDENRKQHFIKVDQLSKLDLDYVQYNVPPEIKIDVLIQSRLLPKVEWSQEDDKTTLYTFTVTLGKISSLPYKGKLTAELFVIANERAGEQLYALMYRSTSDVIFLSERHSSHEFTATDVPLNAYRANWVEVPEAQERGKTYLGYILSVSDSKNNIIAYQTDIKDTQWLTEDISRSVEELRTLYNNNRGSAESRHFNNSFRKVEPPRIPWFKRTVQW